MAFSEYLQLLLKAALHPAKDSETLRWASVLGSFFDELKQAVFKVRRAWVIGTATGEILDLHGLDRGLARYPGENDEAYRLRLQAAYSIYAGNGTEPGMKEALRIVGYSNVTIEEVYKVDPTRWSEFRVIVELRKGQLLTDVHQAAILGTIKNVKPAHTLAILEYVHLLWDELDTLTWDFIENQGMTWDQLEVYRP